MNAVKLTSLPLRLPARFVSLGARRLATVSSASNVINIVEVGPRDGLQNESAIIPAEVKVELINRLGRAGLKNIEAGSFVSPKWVPQMAGTADVISAMDKIPGVHYPVLVPNQKGLDSLLALLSASETPLTDEIAIFTAATDAFAKANTNCTITESLERLSAVTRVALDRGLRVRGYVSVVITCPYSGQVDYRTVRDVSKALLDMGCYEVSLGDTVGTGTPASVSEMLDVVTGMVPIGKLAGHFHDTFGMGVVNVITAVNAGIRTIDASIAGLGGCPYSPGATGNVATEDVLHALQNSSFTAPGDLPALIDTGFWISEKLGRPNASRAGTAYRARQLSKKKEEQRARL